METFPSLCKGGATGTESDSLAARTQGASSGATGIGKAESITTVCAVAGALWGSDVRTERVNTIQHAINTGTYNVSSFDVAGKLINALLKNG
jgi:anti-sigma28 factor (negative regulator of flagellin synthesis)